jgi:hypothetical protein
MQNITKVSLKMRDSTAEIKSKIAWELQKLLAI